MARGLNICGQIYSSHGCCRCIRIDNFISLRNIVIWKWVGGCWKSAYLYVLILLPHRPVPKTLGWIIQSNDITIESVERTIIHGRLNDHKQGASSNLLYPAGSFPNKSTWPLIGLINVVYNHRLQLLVDTPPPTLTLLLASAAPSRSSSSNECQYPIE